MSTLSAHVLKYVRMCVRTHVHTHAYAHRAHARAYFPTRVRIVHTHDAHMHTHMKLVRMHARAYACTHASVFFSYVKKRLPCVKKNGFPSVKMPNCT